MTIAATVAATVRHSRTRRMVRTELFLLASVMRALAIVVLAKSIERFCAAEGCTGASGVGGIAGIAAAPCSGMIGPGMEDG